jgi:CHAD domain-containing protein
MRERETKLLVSPEFRLPRFDDLGHGLRVAADENIEQCAVYFDTPDLRLTRSGASLRYRSDDGWTVKLPAPAEGTNLVRTEISFPGDRTTPPAAALDLLRAWIRTAPVDEVAEVRTSRHRLVLNDAGGTKIAEIDDDRVTTSNRTGTRHEFREVEVELTDRAPDRLDRQLAKQVKKAGSTKTSSLSKVARGLDVRRIVSPEDAAEALDARLDAKATVLDLVRAAIGASVHRLLANDPVIRIGEDPEGVHQARVATRRLRSDLRTFGPLLDEPWSEHLRAELRWLGAALGTVRDADVLTELLRSASTALPDGQQSSAEPLFSRLARQRAREREALLALMRSDRYVTLLERLVAAARDPELTPEKGSRRARKLAPRLGETAWRRLCKAIRNLDDDPADADLHRVRRRAKQARYAFEAIGAVAGKREATRAEIAAGIQGTLGDHQDRVVARQWLIDAADAIDQSRSAFVAGELSARLRAEQRVLRKRARKECREACRS